MPIDTSNETPSFDTQTILGRAASGSLWDVIVYNDGSDTVAYDCTTESGSAGELARNTDSGVVVNTAVEHLTGPKFKDNGGYGTAEEAQYPGFIGIAPGVYKPSTPWRPGGANIISSLFPFHDRNPVRGYNRVNVVISAENIPQGDQYSATTSIPAYNWYGVIDFRDPQEYPDTKARNSAIAGLTVVGFRNRNVNGIRLANAGLCYVWNCNVKDILGHGCLSSGTFSSRWTGGSIKDCGSKTESTVGVGAAEDPVTDRNSNWKYAGTVTNGSKAADADTSDWNTCVKSLNNGGSVKLDGSKTPGKCIFKVSGAGSVPIIDATDSTVKNCFVTGESGNKSTTGINLSERGSIIQNVTVEKNSVGAKVGNNVAIDNLTVQDCDEGIHWEDGPYGSVTDLYIRRITPYTDDGAGTGSYANDAMIYVGSNSGGVKMDGTVIEQVDGYVWKDTRGTAKQDSHWFINSGNIDFSSIARTVTSPSNRGLIDNYKLNGYFEIDGWTNENDGVVADAIDINASGHGTTTVTHNMDEDPRIEAIEALPANPTSDVTDYHVDIVDVRNANSTDFTVHYEVTSTSATAGTVDLRWSARSRSATKRDVAF